MLTPGEGILSKPEMDRIGGARGFSDLRESIYMGGFQNITGTVPSETIYMGGFINVVGGQMAAMSQEIKGLKYALAQQRTILVDSYGMRVGQLKADRDNSIGVF